MKKQRILYLTGIVGVACVVIGVLFFMIFPSGMYLVGETAVSSPTSHSPKQVSLDENWLTAVSDQLESFEYAVSIGEQPMQIAYEAPNRAQNLRTSFFETGIQVEPRLVQAEDWQVGLEIVGLADGMQTIVPELATHTAVDNRITMDYGEWQAWYVNDSRGVEQGFTIEEALFAQETGLLQIDMAVTGDLTPQFVNDDEVRLVTAVGEQVLTYQSLVAFDAQGAELSAGMSVVDLAEGQAGIRLAVDVAEAEYPIVIDPLLGGGIDWVAWLDQPDTDFGFAVSTAGDVNKDGFDDVLVGAHWFDGGASNSGAVFGYYGGPNGLPPTFQWVVEGDVPDMELGYAVNPAGDVNNDGYADVIVGTNMTPTGRAYVYPGTFAGLSNLPVWIGLGEQADDGFGTAVNTAGDVNGDNFDDIIIGAPNYDISGHSSPDGGHAYVFSGEDVSIGNNNPAQAWRAENDLSDAASSFGFSVGTAGDVDNNGYDDVIIGAPYYAPEGISGYAGIFSGTIEGLPGGWGGAIVKASEADWYTEDWGSIPTGSNYGFSVGTAGDVNNDGFADVVVGAPLFSDVITRGGAIFVYTGTNPINNMNSEVDPFNSWSDVTDVEDSLLGYSVGAAGDVDQDGFDDVIAGAPQAVNGGGAFVYRGSAFGFTNDSWEFSSEVDDAKLGTSVGTAGDVNGDGYADVIIGAPAMPNPDSALGEAYSFYGSGQISNLQAFNDSPTTLNAATKLWAEIDVGGVLGYEWDLGDGSMAEGREIAHVYTGPGYYTAVVTGTSLTDEMTATTAVTISASSLITPGGGALKFVNGNTGFGTGVNVPPGAVSDTLQLSYTPLITVSPPPPTDTLGYYFDLNIDEPKHQIFLPMVVKGDVGAGTAVVNSIADVNATDSYTFTTPITVTIFYSDTNLTPEQEKELRLVYWNEGLQQWLDIAVECVLADTYTYYPDENYYTVQVCHLSRFSVAG